MRCVGAVPIGDVPDERLGKPIDAIPPQSRFLDAVGLLFMRPRQLATERP
jgi:hypothetical protein